MALSRQRRGESDAEFLRRLDEHRPELLTEHGLRGIVIDYQYGTKAKIFQALLDAGGSTWMRL